MTKTSRYVQTKSKIYISRLMLLLSIVFLVSCSSDNKDLVDKFKEVSSRAARPIAKIPVVKHMPKFIYPNSKKRRNPFFKFEEGLKFDAKKNQPDMNAPNLKRKRQVLEQYKLKDLIMVGSMRRNGFIWGLVSAPDDIVYKITIGSYIGSDFGRVVSITSKKIRIIETYKENNIWKKRDINIKLNTDKKDIVDHKKVKIEEIIS